MKLTKRYVTHRLSRIKWFITWRIIRPIQWRIKAVRRSLFNTQCWLRYRFSKRHYKFLKIVGTELRSIYTDSPWKKHAWMRRVKKPALCNRGYHVCCFGNINDWVWICTMDSVLVEIEVKGKPIIGDIKACYPEARIVKIFPHVFKYQDRVDICSLANHYDNIVLDKRILRIASKE